MAEKTLSVAVAAQVIKRAQQKTLAKDAAKVLVGIRKAATGNCGDSKRKRKKGKQGVVKTAVLKLAVQKLRMAKSGGRGRQLAKAAAKAVMAIKSGNGMQKQAAIGQYLQKIVPLLAKLKGGIGRAGAAVKPVLSQPVTMAHLAGGAAAAGGAKLLGKSLGGDEDTKAVA